MFQANLGGTKTLISSINSIVVDGESTIPVVTGRNGSAPTNYVIGTGGATLEAGGSNNIIFGDSSAPVLTQGDQNVIIGQGVANSLVDGSNNVILGFAGALMTGSNNTLIGRATDVVDSTDFNVAVGYNATAGGGSATSIGKSAQNTTANSTVIGDTSHDNIRSISSTCDLGTTAKPFQDLHLSGTVETPQINQSGNILIVGASTNVTTVGDTNGVFRFGSNSTITRFIENSPITDGFTNTYHLDVIVGPHSFHVNTFYDLRFSGVERNGANPQSGHIMGSCHKVTQVTAENAAWNTIVLTSNLSAGMTSMAVYPGTVSPPTLRFIIVTGASWNATYDFSCSVSLTLTGHSIASYTFAKIM